jgi:hypothetical protein
MTNIEFPLSKKQKWVYGIVNGRQVELKWDVGSKNNPWAVTAVKNYQKSMKR